MAKGSCVSGSHGTLAIRGVVLGRLPLLGRYADSRLRHSPSFSVREASWIVLELRKAVGNWIRLNLALLEATPT